jgi:hypothetical protein
MLAAIAAWIAVVAGGTIQMIRYSNAPGVVGPAPVVWPARSQMPTDVARPTLVMFVHPHCPCSRASIGELERLVASVSGKVSVRIAFLKPADTAVDWEKTDLWKKASGIPGVSVYTDNDGAEARLFRAETSGQTLLYDSSGKLLFQGGITAARGHAGDNPGCMALEQIVLHGQSQGDQTPVFGCGLFDTRCQKEETLCKP